MLQLALIGAGQLGSRHLQALALFDRPARVTVLDPFDSSLATAKERFGQIQQGKVEAVFTKSFGDLPRHLDSAVVATGADTRRGAIEKLLAQSEVKVALLEKVLFQRLADYDAVGALLVKSGTRAWVNCAQRLWPFFADLRPSTLGKSNVEILVRGANWGLGCNAIHNLDLLHFMTGSAECRIESKLDPGTIPSKRPDFIEFTGTLLAHGERGNRVLQVSEREGDAPFEIEVRTPESSFVWTLKDGAPFQSQLTHGVLAEMLDKGTSVLPGYAESAALHVSMLEVFLRHLGPGADACAIT
jgi:Oxidoreductase family, NAD-binding Rossmann fold